MDSDTMSKETRKALEELVASVESCNEEEFGDTYDDVGFLFRYKDSESIKRDAKRSLAILAEKCLNGELDSANPKAETEKK